MAKPWEETYAQPETKKPWELSYASQEPEELPTRSVGAFAKDVGTSLEKGVIGAEQGIVGLLDIPTGGHVGKYLQEHGFDFEKNQKILSEQYSPQQKAENKALEEAHGVMGTIEAALRNPTAVGALLGESAPSIFAGGLLGKVAKVAKGVSVAGAAGIGEGLIAAGGAEENIRNQSEDGLVSGKGTLAAIGTGIGTGVLGALGSKLTTALGGIDADTLLIGGARRALAAEVGVEAATSPNVFKRVVTSALGEGVFEEAPQSAQEQMWQNYATDKPLMEGVPESATKGALLGSIMGGAVGLLPSAQAPKPLTDEGERKEEPLTPLTPQAAAVVKKNDLKAVGLGPEHPQHAEMMKQDFSTPEGIAAAEAFVQGNSEKLGGINDDAWNKLIAKSKERVGVVEQASVVEEVKAPVVEEVKAPVVEEVKAPIVEPITTPAAKAPRVKKVKAEVAPVEEVKAPVVKEVKSSEPIQIDEAKVTAYDSALERASVLAEGGSKGAARPFMKSLVAQGLISAAQLKKYGNDAPLTELMQAVNTDLQTGRETTLTTPVTPTKIIPHTEFGVKTTKATPIKEKDLTGVERRQQAADVLRAKVEAKKAEIERLETERLAELARIRQDTRDKLALEKTTKKATTSKTTTKPIATSSAAEENEIIKQADENESDDDIMSEQRDDFYFSVAPTSATTGHTAASISKSLSPEMKALVASGKAVIHDTAEGLNKVVPGNHPANVQGLTTKEGVTHYVANKLTPHTMQGVALHEAGVHAGLRKMVGEKVWADITDQAANNPHPTHEAARKAVPKNTPDHLKAEEALAYLVQNSPHMPVVRRLISAIRNWARTTFGANIKLTESDARHLAMKSLRKESKATERTARKETAFSKEKLLAPNGKPSNLNPMQHAQVRTPEFKEWFGDWENDPENASKVVDENGEPKIVYHGTGADISIFDPTKTRIVDGVFFAPDPEHASSYAESFGNLGGKAPNVISAYINVRTPTIIKGVDFDFDSINSAYSDHTNDGAAIIEDDGEIHSFIVWEPNQIKSAIGNTGAFSAENDDIRYSLSSTEQASVAAGEARRAGGPASAPKIGAIENIKKSAASIGTKVFSADARYIRTLRDSLEAIGLPFKDIQPLLLRSSQSQTLNVVSLAERAAVLGGLKKNSDSHIWDAVDDPHKVVNIRHMVEDIAKEKGESYDSVNSIFHDLMVARRIDEVAKRAEKIIATYKGMANVTEKDKAKRLEYANKNRKHVKLAKGLHGYMGKEEVKIHLALLKSDPAYAPLIDEWQAVRKNTIQFLVDTGRYSEEQAATYMDAVAYVPFQRVLEGGEDVDVLYVASTNRHGGKGGLSAGQVEYSLKGQSKREVDDIVSNIEKWVVNSYVKGVKADKSRELIDLADMYLPAGAVEEVGVSSGNKTTVTCYRNGVKEHWKFKDPMMTFAFDSVNPIALQALTVGAKSANILRASIVLDPIFTIAQLPQDTFSAMFTSGVKWPFMLPYEAAKEFTGTLLGPLVGRTTEAHKILKETGAVGGKDFSEKYARSIHDTAYNIKDSGHGIGAKAMQLLNHIAMSGDNAVRQAVYIRTMKELKGNPNAEAIAKDRAFEIINFKRKGASAALDALRQVTPFLGAYLQVQRVAYNTLSGRGISPVSKAEARRTLVSTAAQVTALSIATSVIMRLGDTGDEDDYAKRSLKERFAHIYMNKSMAIPIRNDIFSWPTVLVDYGFSRFVDKSNVDAANAALGESFRRTVLGVPAGPTLIKPILESMMNHDWFTNRPIVPQRLQDRETEFQFNESTSDFSKLVGKSGLISPMLLDHLIKGTTGYAGAAMLSIFDIANRMATNAPYMDKGFYGKTIRDIPGVASMVPKEHFSQDIDTSFALREELDKAATTHKVLKGELNNPEKARQYKAEHRAELSTGAQSRKNSLVSDIDDLNKKIRKLSNTSNEVMSPTTKQERREVLEGRVRHKQGLLSKLYDRVNPN